MKDLYPAEAPLRILDAGCGLGFLTHVAAGCFPEAHITGVDLFTHESVPEMSMARAIKTMELLGIHSRTSLLMHDLTKPLDSDGQYDLAISNVVFHNMGRKRFTAYRSVVSALKPNGFFILGDLFSRDGADVDYLSEHPTLLKEFGQEQFGKWIYKILVLRTHDAVGKSEYGTKS